MTSESSAPGENRANLAPVDNATILKMFHNGFNRLPKMFEGMHQKFDGDFPFNTSLFKIGIGRRFLQTVLGKSSDKTPSPIKLDPVIEIKQQGIQDCVGAAFMSAFFETTGIPVTSELYDGFLQMALKHKLATQDKNGIQVSPFTLNVFSTPEFKQQFPFSEITVALRRGLSLDEISEIATAARNKKNPPYKLHVFLPFESSTRELGGHIVTLQEINPIETTIYDPKLGEQRILPNAEFNRKWQFDNRSAIFVFAKAA